MAYIEVKIGGVFSRIEDTDDKFTTLLNTVMESIIKPNQTKNFAALTKQEQLDSTIDYIVNWLVNTAKDNHLSKIMRDINQESLTEFELVKKEKVTK